MPALHRAWSGCRLWPRQGRRASSQLLAVASTMNTSALLSSVFFAADWAVGGTYGGIVVTVQLASPRGALARTPGSPAEPRCAGPSEAGCTAADAFQRCVVAFGAVARAPGWEGQGRPSPLPTFGAVFILSLLLSVL